MNINILGWITVGSMLLIGGIFLFLSKKLRDIKNEGLRLGLFESSLMLFGGSLLLIVSLLIK